jgi:hypothetical protein
MFAHNFLPHLARRDPKRLHALLGDGDEDRDGFFRSFWKRVGQEFGPELPSDGLRATRASVGAKAALVVRLPPPVLYSEAFYEVFVEAPASSGVVSFRCFTLELGANLDAKGQPNGVRYFLCEWGADGNHRNLGAVNTPDDLPGLLRIIESLSAS